MPYRLDRFISQLRNVGILKACTGMVLGDFSITTDTRFDSSKITNEGENNNNNMFSRNFGSEGNFWRTVCGLQDLNIPILYQAAIGHGNKQNLPIALGAFYMLDCTNKEEMNGTLKIVSDECSMML